MKTKHHSFLEALKAILFSKPCRNYRKKYMSQIFQEDGRMIPVTYLQCEPNTVW